MKKNPAIKEDNKARQFAAVQKVVINNTSSGTSLWVPEDIAETDELSVTENGVYCAYDDNVFGYSQVVVNVSESLNDRSEKDKAISKITGTNPDTGDTESYGVDEDGNLTKEVIPSGLPQAIHIVIEPTKKTYNDGENLDFTGIHVYLLDGEGHQWTSDEYPTGEIPFNELIFPETYADESKAIQTGKTSDLDTSPFTQPIGGFNNYVKHISENGVWEIEITSNNPEHVKIACVEYPLNDQAGSKLVTIIVISDGQGTYTQHLLGIGQYNKGQESEGTYSVTSGSYTYDGKTSYAYWLGQRVGRSAILEGNIVEIDTNVQSWTTKEIMDETAWTWFYGTEEGGKQEIPVHWVRSDGQTLEDTYQITVTANSQPASGGSSSGGEHTGGDF